MHMLLDEGFHYSNYVDIFDAGPIIEAVCSEIRTIKTSQLATVIDILEPINQTNFILSNTHLDFRATISSIDINPNGVIINKETADLLHINLGEEIRFSQLKTVKGLS